MSPSIGTPEGSITHALSRHLTFQYTGAEQTFEVPAGVTQIEVDAHGAGGGEDGSSGKGTGLGGRADAQLTVVPGERLDIFVGGAPSSSGGGYNGGGRGLGSGSHLSFGGGGATDIREGGDGLNDRILVAGGGGGEGGDLGGGTGGNGGGRVAGKGAHGPVFGGSSGCQNAGGGGGGGGSQIRGGAGGEAGCYAKNGFAGKLGIGGAGGGGNSATGGGGGGYYGGGGGGGGNYEIGSGKLGLGGGGGGGSSYADSSARNTKMSRGWKGATGNGLLIVRW
jgi:hypothetical protein